MPSAGGRLQRCYRLRVQSAESILDPATIVRLKAFAERVARPGEELIARLIDIFVTDSGTRFIDCGTAWRANDFSVAGRAAHTIKGSASNLGANHVVEAARVIEEACEAGVAVDDGMLVALRTALDEAHTALRAL